MKKNGIWNKLIMFAEGFLLVNLLWLLAAWATETPVIPSPMDVYPGLATVLSDKFIWHVLYSLKRICAGIGLALVVGIPLGVLMAFPGPVAKLLRPLIYFCYPIPKTALLPVAMLLWGMRDGSKIMIIFLIVVFQVIVAVRDGAVDIEKDYFKLLIACHAGRLQTVLHVILPAVIPEVLTSLRVSVGTAVAVLFFVEGYGTEYGMGYYILNAWSRINYVDMYAGILMISMVGFVLFVLIDQLADWLCRWKKRGMSL